MVDDDLAFHAAGFVVRTNGTWSTATLDRFRRFLRARRVRPTDTELDDALSVARAAFEHGPALLSICSDDPCRGDDACSALKHAAEERGVPTSLTGCHGHCRQAPVVSLRIGERSRIYGQIATDEDRRAIADYAAAAFAADTFLVSSAHAEKYRFDPDHHEHAPSAQLGPLSFLLGHFRGVGTFTRDGSRFEKEVVGTYEAGGRFLALRMEASYPLPEGGSDTHRALVIVGAEPRGITGRAYTDGGGVREYEIARSADALEFEDLLPEHDGTNERARKRLAQTAGGYLERLDVDAGRGFAEYSSIEMRRL